MKKLLSILLLMLCSSPAVLFASEANQAAQEGRFFINPAIGGFDKESTDLDPEINYSLGLGYNYTERLSSIISATYAPERGDEDCDLMTVSIGALYHFMPEERLVPYLSAGAGILSIDGDDGIDDNDHLQFNYGAGLKYFLSKDIALNAEIKHMLDASGEPNSMLYQAGLTFFFGQGKQPLDSDNDGVIDSMDSCPDTPAGAAVDSRGCCLDSDNDGVADYKDKCPETPAGAEVDANGCCLDSDNDGVPDFRDNCPNTPDGAEVDTDGCCLDSDNDGVPDFKDQCPNTPAGAPVNSRGCCLDSDNDGVFDFKDRCPNSPSGARVDKYGCQLKLNLVIEFATDKAEILQKHIPELSNAVKFINKYPDQKILISGYTDSVGSAAYNKQLSQRRADAVKQYIVSRTSIKASRLVAKGYGEDKPIGDNTTAAGRQQNRRVELSVFNQ